MTTVSTPGIYNIPELEAVPIPLGGGHFALVDRADVGLISGHRWAVLDRGRGTLYAYSGGRVYMHRLIAATPQGMETDHINGHGLDNRRCNLRIATPSQNRANMGKPRRPDFGPHTSQFKGVNWDKSRQKWQAKITVNGVIKNLGRYASEIDAGEAYDRAALAAWGEFAWLNFPELEAVA